MVAHFYLMSRLEWFEYVWPFSIQASGLSGPLQPLLEILGSQVEVNLRRAVSSLCYSTLYYSLGLSLYLKAPPVAVARNIADRKSLSPLPDMVQD